MMDDSGRERAYVSASGTDPICRRQAWLQDRVPYYVNPTYTYPSARGTMTHAWLQGWPQPGCFYEERFELWFDEFDVPFTGQLDKVDLNGIVATGRVKIEDLKSKEDPKIPKNGALQENIWQLNCYRVLLKYGSPQNQIDCDMHGVRLPGGTVLKPGVPSGLIADDLILHYFSMSRPQTWKADLISDDEVLWRIRETMAWKLATERPPVPKSMDPLNGKFCTLWCPVRSACIQGMMEEGGDD